jgi:hypothetical protein
LGSIFLAERQVGLALGRLDVGNRPFAGSIFFRKRPRNHVSGIGLAAGNGELASKGGCGTGIVIRFGIVEWRNVCSRCHGEGIRSCAAGGDTDRQPGVGR